MPTSTWCRDHFKLFTRELFAYAVALLLRRRRFEAASMLTREKYASSDARAANGTWQAHFSYALQQHVEWLEQYYRRQAGEHGSVPRFPAAYVIDRRINRPNVTRQDLVQADLVLALSCPIKEGLGFSYWYPDLISYAKHERIALPLFARAETNAGFRALAFVLGVDTPDELRERVEALSKRASMGADPHALTGIDAIASRSAAA
jgi:hypothetical protein